MALDYVSFYNIVGEEVSVPNLVDQFIDFWQQKREVGETQITDFNEGSEIRNMLEFFAIGIFAVLEETNEVGKLPFILLSSGEYLDRIGENPFINLPRITGEEAHGLVTFTLAEAQEGDYIIPAGTLLVDSNTGVVFDTDGDCIIMIGETEADCLVTCLSPGSHGNSGSGDINIISSENTGLDLELLSVTNSEAFSNGLDDEGDEDYRMRLLSNIRAEGFGSFPYYVQLALNVPNVHDVLFIDDEEDDEYTKIILVNGFTKPVADSVLLDVLATFSDLDNKVMNHTFTVDAVEYTTVDLDISLDVVTPHSDPDEYVTNLTKFVNGPGYAQMEYVGLMINQALTRDMIVQAFSVFDNVVEVTSVEVNGEEMTSVEPDENAVIKLGTVNISESEVS